MAFYEVLQILHILQRNICNTSKTNNPRYKNDYVLQILQRNQSKKILHSKK